ncbi:hypothetical protein LINPERPRIM_LOCUS23092 [Linum perenne]
MMAVADQSKKMALLLVFLLLASVQADHDHHRRLSRKSPRPPKVKKPPRLVRSPPLISPPPIETDEEYHALPGYHARRSKSSPGKKG